jgi:hypothetical protein
MEKKLYHVALIFFTAMLLLSILWPYEQQLQHWDLEPNYLVKESDEIFFNNTRIHQYRTEEREELAQQGFKVHRYLKCTYDTTQPLLNFTIINSWRTDQAYIIAEPNARSYFADTVLIALDDSVATLSLDHMDFADHYRLAAWVFQNALDYRRAFIVQGRDSLLLNGTQSNEKANQAVLKDYFRLVGRYQ